MKYTKKGRFWYENDLSVFPTPFVKDKNNSLIGCCQNLVEQKIRYHHSNRDVLIKKTTEK